MMTRHHSIARKTSHKCAPLEPPSADETAIAVDIDLPLDAIVSDIVRQIQPLGQ